MIFTKKILSVLLAAVMVLTMTSFSVSAKTYSGTFGDYVLATNTPTEVGTIAEGMRQWINDTTADNPGCKVTFYVRYRGFEDTFGAPALRLNVNWDAVGYLQQTVPLDGSAITFDWDTILSRANWPQRLGYIRQITLTSGQPIDIYGVSVDVPETKELAAGACVADTAVSIT